METQHIRGGVPARTNTEASRNAFVAEICTGGGGSHSDGTHVSSNTHSARHSPEGRAISAYAPVPVLVTPPDAMVHVMSTGSSRTTSSRRFGSGHVLPPDHTSVRNMRSTPGRTPTS